MCVPLSAYKDLSPIGEGVSGPVYRAQSTRTGTLVALKTLTLSEDTSQDDGCLPLSARREVSILRKLSHRNVIELLDLAAEDAALTAKPGREPSGDDADANVADPSAPASSEPGIELGAIYAVFPYCTTDLASLLDDDVVFSLSEVQHLFRQLLDGLAYIHDNGVIHRYDIHLSPIPISHRILAYVTAPPLSQSLDPNLLVLPSDLKPDNLLLTPPPCCTLQIADFGSARFLPSPDPASSRALTPSVTTLWYRAPELLSLSLSLSHASESPPSALTLDPCTSPNIHCSYTQAIDCWAAGCILAELLLSEPLFQADSEAEMLGLIAACIGPTEPHHIPKESRGEGRNGARLEKRFGRYGEAAVRMLRGFLCWDLRERWSARKGLEIGIEVWGDDWGEEGGEGVKRVVGVFERGRESRDGGWIVRNDEEVDETIERVEAGLETERVRDRRKVVEGVDEDENENDGEVRARKRVKGED